MKIIKTVTFYSYDHYNSRFYRIAMIESQGIANILLPYLNNLYPELYFLVGQGKKYMPKDTELQKVKS